MAIIDTTSLTPGEQLTRFIENLPTSYMENQNSTERFENFRNIIDQMSEDLTPYLENFIRNIINCYDAIEDSYLREMFDIFLDKGADISQEGVNMIFSFNFPDRIGFEYFLPYEIDTRISILQCLENDIPHEFLLNVPYISTVEARDEDTYTHEELDSMTEYNMIALGHLKYSVPFLAEL